MRWSERPPVVRSRFPSLQPLRFDPRALSVAVAHLILVRRMDYIELGVGAFLLLLGAMFALMPVVRALRPLPRWIRVALHLAGIAFVVTSGLLLLLAFGGARIAPSLHRLIAAHAILIGGMALGILGLLIVSGEYFKALRELSAHNSSGVPRDV